MFIECRHIMPSGARCKSPALKDQFFCYYHARLHSTGLTGSPAQGPLRLPSLEDLQGIQTALMQILGALGSHSIDDRRAGLYLYGLQIATKLATHASVPEPRDVVRSLSDDPAKDQVLAPETVQCEPGTECDSCDTRGECVLPARVAYLNARLSCAQTLKDLDRQQREIERENGFSQAIIWENEPEWQDPANFSEDDPEAAFDEVPVVDAIS